MDIKPKIITFIDLDRSRLSSFCCCCCCLFLLFLGEHTLKTPGYQDGRAQGQSIWKCLKKCYCYSTPETIYYPVSRWKEKCFLKFSLVKQFQRISSNTCEVFRCITLPLTEGSPRPFTTSVRPGCDFCHNSSSIAIDLFLQVTHCSDVPQAKSIHSVYSQIDAANRRIRSKWQYISHGLYLADIDIFCFKS